MTDWMTTLPGLWAHAWEALEDGVARPDAPARLVTLATTGLDGVAEARLVVLRGADRRAATVDLFTDSATAKVAELAATPFASLLAWIPGDSLQIRLRLAVQVITGPALDAQWAALPHAARTNYGGAPLPGTPMARPEDYRETTDRARFTQLRGTVQRADLVHLGEALHRRAIFEAADGFAGQWVGP